ncbi:MAG: hypothetical protein PF495_20955, partial [Spirochaetales bacterium]|nr:hypothetical protein [Spirochaetales bacterium]
MKINMKNYVAALSAAALCAGCVFITPSAQATNVCSQGTGIPPFLSSGADPNLLLVIDNSGSMLDMAYVENIDECVDNNYVPTDTYAGLYDSTKWYKWTNGVAPWVNGTTYGEGDYVYTEGVFYKATTAGTSVGAEIKFDSGVIWAKVYEVDTWAHGTTYSAGDIVRFEDQLYKATDSGVSSDPDLTDDVSIDDANGNDVNWAKVDSTWVSGGSYDTEDIVSDNGMLFENKLGTNTIRPSEDTAEAQWHRLNAGYFEETTAAAAATDLADTTVLGDSYTNADLYVKIFSVTVDTVSTPSTVSYFAASGNLLNWASASKFDIQKKILTGGKYDANEEHLVSQSRGCSDHSFYKEIPVTNSASASKVLTLGVKGPSDEEWIDTTDFTTRISIMGVSDGYADSDREIACKAAVDAVTSGGLGDIHQDVTACLSVTVATDNIMTESNSAYNHSLFSCWKMKTTPYDDYTDLGSMSEVQQSCEHIYTLDMPPATITPDFAGYACYGLYNGDADPANADPTPDEDRTGYVGRCWEPSSMPAGCATIPCPADSLYDTGNPRCFTDNLMYECSGNYNAQQDNCNKPWIVQLSDASSDPLVAGTCSTTGSVFAAQWTDDANTSADVNECIQRGVWDYCSGIAVPEVIDPTDQIFDTNVSWGLPGALVDSGRVSMLGTARPLLVMPGYIKKTPEASGTVLPPEGVLHEVAADLRIGAMAFHHNGAATECAAVVTGDTIVQYCPDGNKDGAKVIAPIRGGTDAFDPDGGGPAPTAPYVDYLASKINNIPATSWTPLAEAIYNGLGYYGQRSDRSLAGDDFPISADDDPVQYWCQQNHILVITEGASTTDLNQQVIDLVETTMPGFTPPLEDSTIVSTSEGECLNADGDSLLFGSTYLDDLTYYGAEAPVTDLYASPTITVEGIDHAKQNVLTHIVTTGDLRDNGDTTDECNPKTIMENAAANAGTTLLSGADPSQLEANLRATFSDILSRVSAGSAASVISSSRSGSGAVYQAIFWP